MPVVIDQQLQVRVTNDAETSRIVAHGQMDGTTASRLATILRAMASQTDTLLVLDLRPTSYLDAAGIRLLIDLCDAAPDFNLAFEVQVRAGSQPDKALRESGAHRIFSVAVWDSGLGEAEDGSTDDLRGTLELRIPSDVFQVCRVRRLAEQVLALRGADDTWLCDFVMAIGEAVANAVTHGSRPDGPGYVIFALSHTDDFVVAEVRDFGRGIQGWTGRAQMPPPESIRGRGLGMMRIFTDQLEVETGSTGTLVRLFKRPIWQD